MPGVGVLAGLLGTVRQPGTRVCCKECDGGGGRGTV